MDINDIKIGTVLKFRLVEFDGIVVIMNVLSDGLYRAMNMTTNEVKRMSFGYIRSFSEIV